MDDFHIVAPNIDLTLQQVETLKTRLKLRWYSSRSHRNFRYIIVLETDPGRESQLNARASEKANGRFLFLSGF